MRTTEGAFVLSHVDAVVDDMLRKDYLFDVALPHIPTRWGFGGHLGCCARVWLMAATVQFSNYRQRENLHSKVQSDPSV